MTSDKEALNDKETEELIREIATRLRVGMSPPDGDSEKISQLNTPVTWQILHLGESLHVLRNAVHVLIGLIEQVGTKLDRNAEISQNNTVAIATITKLVSEVRECATSIATVMRVAGREKPLLMRDLPYVETEAIEGFVLVVLVCEAMVFLASSDTLLRSALFTAIDDICPIPMVWGIGCAVLWFISIRAFFVRRKRARMWAAGLNSFYFGVTGGLMLVLQPGAMGWVFHVVLCAFTLWVLLRGPSNAI